MALSLADVLFYWDHRHKLVYPTIPPAGGTFVRAGTAYYRRNTGQHVLVSTNTPRWEPDGLRLEPAQTNVLDDPFNVRHSSVEWLAAGTWTTADATSIFADQTAQKMTNPNDAGNRYVDQNPDRFVLSANPETTYVIVENVDATETHLGVIDWDAVVQACRVSFTWSTAAVALESSPLATAETYGAVKLTDVGPSGGPVYMLWMTATYDNSGNNAGARVYPTGYAQNDGTAIIHAMQHVQSSYITSPIDGARVAEALTFNNPPAPQPLVIYARFKMQTKSTNATAGHAVYRWSGTDPDSLGVQITAGGLFQSRIEISDSAAWVSAATTAEPGELVEFVQIINADTSARMIVRIDGGAVVVGSGAGPAGSLPASWTDPTDFALSANSLGPSFQAFKVVTQTNIDSALDGTGTGDEDVMAEMARLQVSQDRQRVSPGVTP